MIKAESLVLLSDYSLTNIATEVSEARLTWTTMGHRGIHRGCLSLHYGELQGAEQDIGQVAGYLAYYYRFQLRGDLFLAISIERMDRSGRNLGISGFSIH